MTATFVTPEPDWAALRREFPATARLAYLNIASKGLLPRAVDAAMAEWMADVNATGGETSFSMAEIEKTRRTVAETFGAPPECVALIKNTTEGIAVVAGGFPWREGDNVVISAPEHENNTFPWRRLAARGIEVRSATPDATGRVTPDRYLPLIDARTRILSVAWVVYGNGYRADLAAIAAICRARGVRLVVDGIQAVGVLDQRVDALGADVVVAGGHKAQMSLTGAGFMYVSPEMTALLEPPYAGKFSFTSNDRFRPTLELAPDAHRFEYGNPNFLGIHVQRRSAEMIQAIGLGRIERRVESLTTRLIEEAERRQLRVRTPRPWAERAGHVSLDLGRHAGPVAEALRADGVIVSEKDGHLRASVHFYNDDSDIDRFLDALVARQR
ncbi:MAG: aminotransferase class V-fold PLP-dependent enzyme [Alphaproteobacteria bacterium]